MADPLDVPLLEFDPSPTAIVEPSEIRPAREVPRHLVLCFFRDVIRSAVAEFDGREIGTLGSEMGSVPIYELSYGGHRLGLAQAAVGAPLAAGWLEELIADGFKAFVVCGGAGALVRELTLGHVVVPTSAVRDEGTSYHYLPASREVAPTDDAVQAILAALERHEVPFVTGKTWTTDAFYRETRAAVARRVAEGCLTVEMEAAAFFAVARFRGVSFGQVLYAGDDLSQEAWDARGWDGHVEGRELLFRIAAEAVLAL
ncbi:MAG TPA: nucleoside phosphorylase [Candidatus Limnocylindrales bacterium]|nr:nucleoside phosphorylase [Candidatus Limnocylindrales bacterium]